MYRTFLLLLSMYALLLAATPTTAIDAPTPTSFLDFGSLIAAAESLEQVEPVLRFRASLGHRSNDITNHLMYYAHKHSDAPNPYTYQIWHTEIYAYKPQYCAWEVYAINQWTQELAPVCDWAYQGEGIPLALAMSVQAPSTTPPEQYKRVTQRVILSHAQDPKICERLGEAGIRDCVVSLCLRAAGTTHTCYSYGQNVNLRYERYEMVNYPRGWVAMDATEWRDVYADPQFTQILPRLPVNHVYFMSKLARTINEQYICDAGFIMKENVCVDDRANQCIMFATTASYAPELACSGHGVCEPDVSVNNPEANILACRCDDGFSPNKYDPQLGLPNVPYCSSSCQDNWGVSQDTCLGHGTCDGGACTCDSAGDGRFVAYGKACEWPGTIAPVSSGAGVDIILTYSSPLESPATNDVRPVAVRYRASFAPTSSATKTLTETISGSTKIITLVVVQDLDIMTSVTQPITSNILPTSVETVLFDRLAEQVATACTLPFQQFPDGTIFTAAELGISPTNPAYAIRNSICNAPPISDVQIIPFENQEVYCIPVRDTAKRILGNTYCWSNSTSPLQLSCQFEDTQNVLPYLISTRGTVGDMATLRWDALEYQLADKC